LTTERQFIFLKIRQICGALSDVSPEALEVALREAELCQRFSDRTLVVWTTESAEVLTKRLSALPGGVGGFLVSETNPDDWEFESLTGTF
jgi:hypothetical protein